MTRLTIAGGLLALIVAVLVACGSDSGEAEPSDSAVQTTTKPATAAPSIPEGAVRVINKDVGGSGKYEFDPPNFTFKVGQEVTFALSAETEFHTFTVDELGISEEMDAGETKIVTFTFDKAGVYELICIPHESLGMIGQIVVE
jgi:plastocyanin